MDRIELMNVFVRLRLRVSVSVSLGQVQLARVALRFAREHPPCSSSSR